MTAENHEPEPTLEEVTAERDRLQQRVTLLEGARRSLQRQVDARRKEDEEAIPVFKIWARPSSENVYSYGRVQTAKAEGRWTTGRGEEVILAKWREPHAWGTTTRQTTIPVTDIPKVIAYLTGIWTEIQAEKEGSDANE